MEKILSEFGVQPVLLAAQVVNFLILLFILKKFLYGPILNVLQKRKDAIATSLENAEEIEKRLVKLAEEEEKRRQKSIEQAEKIINEATQTTASIKEETKQETAAMVVKMFQDAEKQKQADKEQLKQEVMAESAELIAKGVRAVLEEQLTDKKKKNLRETILKGLKL